MGTVDVPSIVVVAELASENLDEMVHSLLLVGVAIGLQVMVLSAPVLAAVGGGVVNGVSVTGGEADAEEIASSCAIVSWLSFASWSRDLSEPLWSFELLTVVRNSEKSPGPIEKRIGGRAGAMYVECETRSTGDDSSESSTRLFSLPLVVTVDVGAESFSWDDDDDEETLFPFD